jgi:hypothetical protein
MNTQPIERIEVDEKSGLFLEIYYDESAENPRDNSDSLGTLYGTPTRHPIRVGGDAGADDGLTYDEWSAVPERYQEEHSLEEALCEGHRRAGNIFIPLSFDYDGLQECSEDTADAILYVRKDKLLKEFNKKRLSQSLRETGEKILRAELSEYQAWQRGEVYGYVIRDRCGEVLDSCWGFYEDMDYCIGYGMEEGSALCGEGGGGAG